MDYIDYKELYEATFKYAKQLYDAGSYDNETLEAIFPELKESEDEKIKKDIISHFAKGIEGSSFDEVREKYKIWIAWLEKQGEQKPYGQRQKCVNCQFNYAGECKGSCVMRKSEQKPTDKVEPKFKIGDKIVEKDFGECSCGTIIDIKDGKYIFDDGGFICIEEQDLWKLVEQKPAWSEEDEQMMNSFLHKVEVCNLLTNKENIWIINKLKDLKNRYTWKPSDEQMKALSIAMCGVDDPLFSLYQDLKKLREE